jgi:hypothetical protein
MSVFACLVFVKFWNIGYAFESIEITCSSISLRPKKNFEIFFAAITTQKFCTLNSISAKQAIFRVQSIAGMIDAPMFARKFSVIHILQFTQIESNLCLCGVIVKVHRALLLEVVAQERQISSNYSGLLNQWAASTKLGGK